MKAYLKQERFKEDDKAWLIVDKDQWADSQLEELFSWSQLKNNYDFALSNPKFELWLLLHFEDGNNISSSQNCSERLRRHIPDYNKKIHVKDFTEQRIRQAIDRAKRKDSPQCKKWPITTGTTVYRLVENILKETENF